MKAKTQKICAWLTQGGIAVMGNRLQGFMSSIVSMTIASISSAPLNSLKSKEEYNGR